MPEAVLFRPLPTTPIQIVPALFSPVSTAAPTTPRLRLVPKYRIAASPKSRAASTLRNSC